MKTPSCVRVATVLCALGAVGTALFAVGESPVLQPKAEENPKDKQARVYRELFEKVGRSGLPDLAKSKDTGLALQASWELHKKLVKRSTKKEASDPDGTYDAAEVKKFLDFLKDRTKAPVPDWWKKGISELDVDVDRAKDHAYFGEDPRKLLTKIELGERPWYVRNGVKLTLRDGTYSYQAGDVAIEYKGAKQRPYELFTGDGLVDVIAGKVTCLATYSTASAFPFHVAGFESKGSKCLWESEVWALNKRQHFGATARHRVELTTKGDTVFVFGEEVAGLYLEAFELGTGKCQFRFCTSYWGHYSEKWNLKPGD
jgi:hypothetical protein